MFAVVVLLSFEQPFYLVRNSIVWVVAEVGGDLVGSGEE